MRDLSFKVCQFEMPNALHLSLFVSLSPGSTSDVGLLKPNLNALILRALLCCSETVGTGSRILATELEEITPKIFGNYLQLAEERTKSTKHAFRRSGWSLKVTFLDGKTYVSENSCLSN